MRVATFLSLLIFFTLQSGDAAAAVVERDCGNDAQQQPGDREMVGLQSRAHQRAHERIDTSR